MHARQLKGVLFLYGHEGKENEGRGENGHPHLHRIRHFMQFSPARVTTEISFLRRPGHALNQLELERIGKCARLLRTSKWPGTFVSSAVARFNGQKRLDDLISIPWKKKKNNNQNWIESESRRTIETLKERRRLSVDCFVILVRVDLYVERSLLFQVKKCRKSKRPWPCQVSYFLRRTLQVLLFLFTNRPSGSPPLDGKIPVFWRKKLELVWWAAPPAAMILCGQENTGPPVGHWRFPG